MDLTSLRPVYEREGPFVTVYLEARAPSENAESQVRLRWKALRERLESDGADSRAADAVENLLTGGPPGEEQANGRVIVADPGGVALDAPWDAALGAGDAAHSGVIPELGPYVREKARAVRALVAVVGQERAVIRRELIARESGTQTEDVENVEGGPVVGTARPRGQGHAHNRIQRRADETVKANAKEVSEYLRKTAAAHPPDVLVLAGGVQARTAVREVLPVDLERLLVETDRGGAPTGEADTALSRELLRIAGELARSEAEKRANSLREGIAHADALEGDRPVAAAAESGAVDTLLFEPGADAAREAYLLKVCAGTSSSMALVTEGTGLKDGVGALLRFPPEGTSQVG